MTPFSLNNKVGTNMHHLWSHVVSANRSSTRTFPSALLLRHAAAKEQILESTFLAMDLQATGITKATAGSATICFERYGEEMVYKAFVHPVGLNKAELENIASCFMQPDIPEEDVSERMNALLGEIEEDVEIRCVTRRGRNQRNRRKEPPGGEDSTPLKFSHHGEGISAGILGMLQSKVLDPLGSFQNTSV